MAIRHAVSIATLLAVMATPLFQQQPQHSGCTPPPKPVNCPPVPCASPGPTPEWPCGELNGKVTELRARLERMGGMLRAVVRELKDKRGRSVTEGEITRFTLAARLALAAAGGPAGMQMQQALGAASIGKFAASYGYGDPSDPNSSSALAQMSAEQLENMASVLTQSITLASEELKAAQEEMQRCADNFDATLKQWTTKNDAYLACQYKYGEDLKECERYTRQSNEDCDKK